MEVLLLCCGLPLLIMALLGRMGRPKRKRRRRRLLFLPRPTNGREPLGYGVRRQVLLRDGYRCRYCGTRVEDGDWYFHIDHVTPISQGGKNGMDNLVTACPSCNLKKGGRTPGQAGMKLRPNGWRRF